MNSIVDCGHIAKLTLFPRWSRSIWITAWEQRKFADEVYFFEASGVSVGRV